MAIDKFMDKCYQHYCSEIWSGNKPHKALYYGNRKIRHIELDQSNQYEDACYAYLTKKTKPKYLCRASFIRHRDDEFFMLECICNDGDKRSRLYPLTKSGFISLNPIGESKDSLINPVLTKAFSYNDYDKEEIKHYITQERTDNVIS